ncbi:MAG: adenylate/guanylate cyclase domain-containing protein, partial [Rhodospirillaceae bacterium]
MILPEDHAQERLRAAERRGLKLAIFCRTFIIGIGAGWYIGIAQLYGTDANPWAVSALAIYFFSGLIYFFVIGTSWDLPALKYAVYAADVVGICVLFAILPLWSGDAVPQILVFRAYGIYYLFPILALSTLALSWRLVIWTGLAIVISWWGLFVSLIWPLTDTVSWGSLTPDADAAQYIAILLDPGFIGTGNRMEETALLLFAALILALTVYRARAVFFAQIKAEAERSFLTRTFGEYVPEYLSRQLLDDPSALAPHERYATVMSVDIAGFTTFAERSTPSQTIGMLNAFFTDAAALIGESEGLIVDFSGDGFLATYNAP